MLETIADIPARIATLKRRLDARRGQAAFRENVPALEAEIARLEGLTQNLDDEQRAALASGSTQEPK